jgi:hypothetical protein
VLARFAHGLGLIAGVCALVFWLVPSGAPASVQPPGNDNFLRATRVNSPGTRLNSFKTTNDTIGATVQSNVLGPCNTSTCQPGLPEVTTCEGVRYGSTVWYDFFPDRSGQVEIQTREIPNVIALYKIDQATGQPDWIKCAQGSTYTSNVLTASVQGGQAYAYQIGSRGDNAGGGLLKMQFSFAPGSDLAVAPFRAKPVFRTIPVQPDKLELLRLVFVELTTGESPTAACTSCSVATFRATPAHGRSATTLKATSPSVVSSGTRLIVLATSPAQIGRFKLYAADVADYRLNVISQGCVAPGVTSVTKREVEKPKLLDRVPCPAPVVNSTGGEYVFWASASGRLWEKRYTGGAWTASRPLATAKLASAPTVAVHANGEQDVFWKGRKDSLCETWYAGKWYTPHNCKNGPLASAPTAGVDAFGDEYVFWQGTDASLNEQVFSGGRWSSSKLTAAGHLDSAPAVAVHSTTGEQDVFWKGDNGHLWEYSPYTYPAHGPQDLGGQLVSGPAVGVDAAGNDYVFWQGSNGTLLEMFNSPGKWTGPIQIKANRLESPPAVAVHANGQQDVFYKGPNGRLWEIWYIDKWSRPKDLGGRRLGSAPSAGVYATNKQPPA